MYGRRVVVEILYEGLSHIFPLSSSLDSAGLGAEVGGAHAGCRRLKGAIQPSHLSSFFLSLYFSLMHARRPEAATGEVTARR